MCITMLILANRQRIVACSLLCNENVVITRVRAWFAYIMRAHAAVRGLADINTAAPDATMRYPDRDSPQTIIHACVRAAGRTSRRVTNPPLHDRVHRLGKRLSARPMQFHTRINLWHCITSAGRRCSLTAAPVKPLPAFDKPADVYAVAIRRRAPLSFACDRFIRRH